MSLGLTIAVVAGDTTEFTVGCFKEGVVAYEHLFPCLQLRHRAASAFTFAEDLVGDGLNRQGLQGCLIGMAFDATGVRREAPQWWWLWRRW